MESDTVKTTKITDLNSDCMEAIFVHLEFDDLVNVAECSKQFYTAACGAYKRNYANHGLQTLIYDPNNVRCNYDWR